MVKALWFLARLGALVAAVVWVANRPGNVHIEWLGYQIDTSVGFLLLCIGLLMFISALLYRMWRAFITVPKIFRRYHSAQNREKGYHAITRGLVAVASGDDREAGKQAKRAAALLPDRALTRLLSAQAALMKGDDATARIEFNALLEDKDAAFFGLRGLLNDARRNNNREEAVRLMRHAEKLQPRRGWIIKMLFAFETEAGDWDKAEQTLSKAVKTGVIDREAGKRHRLAILLARSDDASARGIPHAALSFAKKAFSADPSFTPAAVRLARLLLRTNKRRHAVRVIERAWKDAPHPALVPLWEEAQPPPRSKKAADPALESYVWSKRLASFAPHHPETKRMLGKAALDAKLWGEARAHLKAARAYRLLAKLEQQETGNESRAREWLELAADAPPRPAWTCESCGHIAPSWTALCPNCRNFNSLIWTVPRVDLHRPAAVDSSNYELIEPPGLTSETA